MELDRSETSMARPEVGDQVSWNTPQGRTHGTVVEVRERDFELAQQKFTASQDNPMFIVESAKSGHRAAHRADALRVQS
jgi:surface antigen